MTAAAEEDPRAGRVHIKIHSGATVVTDWFPREDVDRILETLRNNPFETGLVSNTMPGRTIHIPWRSITAVEVME